MVAQSENGQAIKVDLLSHDPPRLRLSSNTLLPLPFTSLAGTRYVAVRKILGLTGVRRPEEDRFEG